MDGVLLASAFALVAWAPWLTTAAVARRVETALESAWAGVADGCGLSCAHCGVHGVRWVPFGREVELEYACGMLPEDAPQYHQIDTLYVSFIGTIHGLARP
ncbi:MAG: hypothetical protein ACRDG5_08750 [Anaerolineales bacterium]